MITAYTLEADIEYCRFTGTGFKRCITYRGFEEVSNITTRYGELNFTKNPLIVTGIPHDLDMNVLNNQF